jgi:hypothetical protein
MKTKKSWSWTEAQRRRHTPGRYHYWNNVPSDFVRQFNKANRTKAKKSIHEVMLGKDPDFIDFSSRYPKRCAGWIYF